MEVLFQALRSRNPALAEIAREIEARRIQMGKTSGFERLYARVTRLYFGGIHGFNYFDPQQIGEGNPYRPSVVLTALTQGGSDQSSPSTV